MRICPVLRPHRCDITKSYGTAHGQFTDNADVFDATYHFLGGSDITSLARSPDGSSTGGLSTLFVPKGGRLELDVQGVDAKFLVEYKNPTQD